MPFIRMCFFIKYFNTASKLVKFTLLFAELRLLHNEFLIEMSHGI